MSDESEKIVVSCACGARMKVRASSVGKKTKCPKCQRVFEIVAPPAMVTADPAPSEIGLLDDLASQEGAAEAISVAPPAAASKKCPQCGAHVGDAVMCVMCGHNTATGKSVSPAKARTERGVVKAASSFMLGAALSAGFAAVGGVVWFLVVWYLNLEVGYVAWGIGLLAGLGMHLGYRDANTKAGVVAASMSLASIILAKAAIFGFVMYAVISGDTNDPELRKTFVTAAIAEEVLDERGIESESERENQWDSAWSEAEQRVNSMSPADIEAKHKEVLAAAETADSPGEEGGEADAEDESSLAEADESPSVEEASAGLAAFAVYFFQTQFGLFDLLWVFLAVSSAFRLGSRGFSVAEES